MSCERIVETMRDLHGVTLSEGAVVQILERAGRKAEPVAEKIKQQVITGGVIKSDETSARVEGRNWRQWVFISEAGIYHTIVPTRSAAEIETVMGQLCVEAWVCDYFGAQLKALPESFNSAWRINCAICNGCSTLILKNSGRARCKSCFARPSICAIGL